MAYANKEAEALKEFLLKQKPLINISALDNKCGHKNRDIARFLCGVGSMWYSDIKNIHGELKKLRDDIDIYLKSQELK